MYHRVAPDGVHAVESKRIGHILHVPIGHGFSLAKLHESLIDVGACCHLTHDGPLLRQVFGLRFCGD